ncbi:hypothetical protein AOLI_G00084230 [Acnodon oligacanthus]
MGHCPTTDTEKHVESFTGNSAVLKYSTWQRRARKTKGLTPPETTQAGREVCWSLSQRSSGGVEKAPVNGRSTASRRSLLGAGTGCKHGSVREEMRVLCEDTPQ